MSALRRLLSAPIGPSPLSVSPANIGTTRNLISVLNHPHSSLNNQNVPHQSESSRGIANQVNFDDDKTRYFALPGESLFKTNIWAEKSHRSNISDEFVDWRRLFQSSSSSSYFANHPEKPSLNPTARPFVSSRQYGTVAHAPKQEAVPPPHTVQKPLIVAEQETTASKTIATFLEHMDKHLTDAHPERVFTSFNQLSKKNGVELTLPVYHMLLRACLAAKDASTASRIFSHMLSKRRPNARPFQVYSNSIRGTIELPSSTPSPSLTTCELLLSVTWTHPDPDKTLALFKTIKTYLSQCGIHPSPSLYAMVLEVCTKSKQPRLREAQLILDEMSTNTIQWTDTIYAVAIRVAGMQKQTDRLAFYLESLRARSESIVSSKILAALVQAYLKCDQLHHASEFFSDLIAQTRPVRSMVTLDDMRDLQMAMNALISWYAKSGKYEEAFNVYNDYAVSGFIRPNLYTYTSLMNACTKVIKKKFTSFSELSDESAKELDRVFSQGQSLFAILSERPQLDVSIYTCYMDLLGNASIANPIKYSHHDLRKVVDTMMTNGVVPSVVTFGVWLKTIAKQPRSIYWSSNHPNPERFAIDDALDVFALMKKLRVVPNSEIFTYLFQACFNGRPTTSNLQTTVPLVDERLFSLAEEMRVSTIHHDEESFATLIRMYAFQDNFTEMWKLWGNANYLPPTKSSYSRGMNLFKKANAYESIFYVCSERGPENISREHAQRACSIYRTDILPREKSTSDWYLKCYTYLLKCVAICGDVDVGLDAIRRVEEGFEKGRWKIDHETLTSMISIAKWLPYQSTPTVISQPDFVTALVRKVTHFHLHPDTKFYERLMALFAGPPLLPSSMTGTVTTDPHTIMSLLSESSKNGHTTWNMYHLLAVAHLNAHQTEKACDVILEAFDKKLVRNVFAASPSNRALIQTVMERMKSESEVNGGDETSVQKAHAILKNVEKVTSLEWQTWFMSMKGCL